MKKTLILLLVITFLTGFVEAKTIEEDIYEGKSIEVPGYNISLMIIGNQERSIVACINNEISIINRNERLSLGNLRIEPAKIYENYAKIRITYSCEECICDESCSNDICFNKEQSKEKNEFITVDENETLEEDEMQGKNGIQNMSIILFLIVAILLAIIITKKKG